MTVGELVYQQAIKDGFDPSLAERLVSPLSKVAESYQKAFETMREPMKAVSTMVETMQEPIKRIYSAAESMRPQLESMNKLQLPAIPELPSRAFMPSYMYDEDGEFTLPEFVRPVQEVRIVNPEVLALAPAREERGIAASYQLPGNAKWELLEMHFIDGHFVRVSYPGMEPKKFDYKDMGFINIRSVKPDMKWELLRLIASHGGSLTKNHWDRRFHRNIKYELAEGLRQFFGMTTSPIPRYTRRDGYTTLFVIKEL